MLERLNEAEKRFEAIEADTTFLEEKQKNRDGKRVLCSIGCFGVCHYDCKLYLVF